MNANTPHYQHKKKPLFFFLLAFLYSLLGNVNVTWCTCTHDRLSPVYVYTYIQYFACSRWSTQFNNSLHFFIFFVKISFVFPLKTCIIQPRQVWYFFKISDSIFAYIFFEILFFTFFLLHSTRERKEKNIAFAVLSNIAYDLLVSGYVVKFNAYRIARACI